MLLECVPNFSEGSDSGVLKAIADAIATVPGVSFLGLDSGQATNRTVMTFAGHPDAVCEAAFRAIKTAAERIDMRQHRGTHPRIGATDVCPLIPLQGLTVDKAAGYARQLAKRVGEELAIPVYLYGLAATSPSRVHLSAIRRGGYERLADRMCQIDGRPDFGPQNFQPESGATVIGVRHLMLAYNINLTPGRLKLAQAIAGQIRESGRQTRRGKLPGLFPGVKALGWHLESEGWTQVSTNIMNLEAAPLHRVYETVKTLAAAEDCAVLGSELVGLTPRQPLLDAGAYYQRHDPHADADLIQAAVEGLGLNRVKPFYPDRHILEECLQLAQSLLISHSSSK